MKLVCCVLLKNNQSAINTTSHSDIFVFIVLVIRWVQGEKPPTRKSSYRNPSTLINPLSSIRQKYNGHNMHDVKGPYRILNPFTKAISLDKVTSGWRRLPLEHLHKNGEMDLYPQVSYNAHLHVDVISLYPLRPCHAGILIFPCKALEKHNFISHG